MIWTRWRARAKLAGIKLAEFLAVKRDAFRR